MNRIVIYKSEYGAAKKYAEHIAKNLGCEALPLKEAKNVRLDAYDAVIFGGGVYAGKINGADFIVKNFDKLNLKEKKLAVFTVSLNPVEEQSVLESYAAASFPAEIRDKIKFFYFRGGMDIDRLSFVHRSMMRMMKKMLEKKSPGERSASDNCVISIVNGKAEDFFNAEAAAPLIGYIKG